MNHSDTELFKMMASQSKAIRKLKGDRLFHFVLIGMLYVAAAVDIYNTVGDKT